MSSAMSGFIDKLGFRKILNEVDIHTASDKREFGRVYLHA
jgi:hypothetical protein